MMDKNLEGKIVFKLAGWHVLFGDEIQPLETEKNCSSSCCRCFMVNPVAAACLTGQFRGVWTLVEQIGCIGSEVSAAL